MTRLVVEIGVEAAQEVRLHDYGSFSFNFGHGLTSGDNAQNFYHIKSPYKLKRVRNTGNFKRADKDRFKDTEPKLGFSL